MRFLGRENELESLRLLLDKQSSSIVAVNGEAPVAFTAYDSPQWVPVRATWPKSFPVRACRA